MLVKRHRKRIKEWVKETEERSSDGGMGRIVTSLNNTDEDTEETVKIIENMEASDFV